MKYSETRLYSPDMSSGHFFCPPIGPLTRPSPLGGEGEDKA
jgi:hypothetical protein